MRHYATPGKQTPASKGEVNRDFRVYLNPMGRNAGSVWTITPPSYRGSHPATMPRAKCLPTSCPEGETVLDCFGGAGTTALAALQLGHSAISIDINPEYKRKPANASPWNWEVVAMNPIRWLPTDATDHHRLFNAQYMTRLARIALMPPKAMPCQPSSRLTRMIARIRPAHLVSAKLPPGANASTMRVSSRHRRFLSAV